MIAPVYMSAAVAITCIVAVAPAEQPTVALEVDLSALPDDYTTEYIDGHLAEHQVRVLADGGIHVVDDAESTIVVKVSRYGEGDIHYQFSVALLAKGEDVPVVERTLTCELCPESDLFTKIGEEVARMSGRLLYANHDEPGPEGDGGEVTPQPEPAPREEPPPVRRIGAAGWAGIASAAVGLAVVVGGVVDQNLPPERELNPSSDRTYEVTQPRMLGTALVGVGAGLVAMGAVLVTVDQTALLRRRRRARQAAIAPTFSPTGLGLTWRVRF